MNWSVCVTEKKSSVTLCYVLQTGLWCLAVPFCTCTFIICDVPVVKNESQQSLSLFDFGE